MVLTLHNGALQSALWNRLLISEADSYENYSWNPFRRLGARSQCTHARFSCGGHDFCHLQSLRPIHDHEFGGPAKMDKFRHDPDAFPGNRVVTPGPERDGIPTAAAEEQYAQRAFPAAYVPFEFTKKARQGWGEHPRCDR